jgi:tRNA-2-methylthio-N6-dimethylallyladenosine synthase
LITASTTPSDTRILPQPVYVHVRTYGCQMNVLDSQIIEGMLTARGYTMVDDESRADAILFNTCSVRDLSERKVLGKLGTLRHARKRRPELVLGVCGCMAELSGERLLEKNPHVDFVCGTRMRHCIPDLLDTSFTRRLASVRETKHNQRHTARLHEAFSDINREHEPDPDLPPLFAVGVAEGESLDERLALRPKPWQAFVEIIRGCSNFCSYCVVPHARGAEVSRQPHDIISEIEELAENGCREITLLGQNVNSYGMDLQDSGTTFANLLRRINGIDGIDWLRFVTSNPHDISEELIQAIAECEKVCSQIHFPLQSGSNRILKLMNRKYTREQYLEKVIALRSAVPEMSFSSDFIVGFPSETDEDFAVTRSVMEEVRFASSFIFKYSPRPGTAAAEMDDDVPDTIKKERHQELLALQNSMTHEIHKAQIGKTHEVLVDGPSKRNPAMLQGRTSGYFNVVFPGDESLQGTFVKIRMERATPLTLYGKIV